MPTNQELAVQLEAAILEFSTAQRAMLGKYTTGLSGLDAKVDDAAASAQAALAAAGQVLALPTGVGLTTDERNKLNSVAAGATVNSSDAALINRSNHTGAQPASSVADLPTALSKLAGVAVNATANSADAVLKDRASHTGAQPSSSVTGLDAALSKLAGITLGATANSTDLVLKDRANHTGTQPLNSIAGLASALADKQAALVPGITLKTVGGQSLIGSGNIPMSGGASSPEPQTLVFSGVNPIVWNAALGSTAFLTLTGNATLALPTNTTPGSYTLFLLMGSVADRSLTLAPGYAPSSVTLSGAVGSRTIMDMRYDGAILHIVNVYREVLTTGTTPPPGGGTTPSINSLWFDPTDITTLYQDSTGTTELTAAGQPIGRMADKASGIHWMQASAAAMPVLGVRKVNRLLETAALGNSPWGLNNMTHSGGTLTCTNATTSFHRQFVTVVPGTQYTLSFKAKKGSATDVKYSVYDAVNALDIVAPTSYNAQINASTDTLVAVTFTAPAGCNNVAVYTSRDMPSLGTVTVKEPQLELGAAATAYQAVSAGGDYGAAATPLGVAFDGNDGLAAAAFVAGTLGANMDVFIPMKRNTSGKVVSLYDNAANGERYVGTMATANGTVDLGSGAPTYAVNGNVLAAATRPAIEAAMGTGRWSLLEIRNANLSGWTGIGVGGYATFELNGSIGSVRVMPAQTDAARTSLRDSIMASYGITAAPVVTPAPPAPGDFYNTRIQNLLPMQKQIRQIYYEVYFTGYTVNDLDTRFNEWVLFTAQPKVPVGWSATKDNYGDGTFVMPNMGEAHMSNDKLLAAHNRGVRLVLSLGGAGAGFNIDTDARRQKLLDSIVLMVSQLSAGSGVGNIISGISWNTFEAYLRGVYASNPANCTANTANMVWISQQLAALYGPNFSFHMPPSSSFSYSPYDIIVARAMKASGLPFIAAPQNYDDDYSTKTPGVVSTNNKQWAADIGQDATMIGLACGFKGSYARAMTLPFMQTELDNYLAAYPNIRGFFLWSQHDKINADMPAWMTYVIGKIPGKV
jgi:hypothetical protein